MKLHSALLILAATSPAATLSLAFANLGVEIAGAEALAPTRTRMPEEKQSNEAN